MKNLLCATLCCLSLITSYSQTGGNKSGKNKLSRNSDSQQIYFGCGPSLNTNFYKLTASDASGIVQDNLVVSGLAGLFTGRLGVAFHLRPRVELSLVTYPAAGVFYAINHSSDTRLTYEVPLLAELFFGKRGKDWGGFAGGGITANGITNMPGEYSSELTSNVYTFAPDLFYLQAEAGFQYKTALFRFSFSKSFKNPFGNGAGNSSVFNKNYGIIVGVSAIYQIPGTQTNN